MFRRKSYHFERNYFLEINKNEKFALALTLSSVTRPLRSGFLEAWTEAVLDVDSSLPTIRSHIAGQPPAKSIEISSRKNHDSIPCCRFVIWILRLLGLFTSIYNLLAVFIEKESHASLNTSYVVNLFNPTELCILIISEPFKFLNT